MLLLPEASPSAAARIAERVRTAFADDPLLLGDLTPYPLTVSLGVATVDHESLSIDELVHRADTALYEAKRAGRDRVVSARPAADPDTERRAS